MRQVEQKKQVAECKQLGQGKMSQKRYDKKWFKRDEVTKKLCRKGNDKREYCGRIDESINKGVGEKIY